ncbi:ribosome assembly cofactor RimP [Odoribacter lunatus]|uniref:ribosome assembly cofactor RimP n=1 Tax=Odoribacter lunatus TaxID=2941335 RepID=UPI00203CD922|nr:ribosome assembly cofactor RimP [Odoribacter lunatus]
MKSTEELKTIVESLLENSELFLVDISVSKDNKIEILIDSPQGVNITTCIDISRKLDKKLNRDEEDFELTVASAGIGYPFKVEGQYKKNIGNTVEIKLKDKTNLKGTLKNFNGDHIIVETEQGKTNTIQLADIKEIKDIITF